MGRAVQLAGALGLAALVLAALLAPSPPVLRINNIVGPTDDRAPIRDNAAQLGWSDAEIDFAFRAVGMVECTTAGGTARNTFVSVGVPGTMTTVARALLGRTDCAVRRHGDAVAVDLAYPSGAQALGTTTPGADPINDFVILQVPAGLADIPAYPVDPTGMLALTSTVLYLVSAAANDWGDLDQPLIQLCRRLAIEPATATAGASAAVTCDARGMMGGSVLLARDSEGALVAVGILSGIAPMENDGIPASVEDGSFSRVILYRDLLYEALLTMRGKRAEEVVTGLGEPFAGIRRGPVPAGTTVLAGGVPVFFSGVTFEETWNVHFDPDCDELDQPSEQRRAIARLRVTLAKYPESFLSEVVTDISVCRYLNLNSYDYGGTWSPTLFKLYIAIEDTSDFELSELEKTFHHELSSGLLYDLGKPFPFDAWIQATGGYPYDDIERGRVFEVDGEVGLEPRREFLERGYILPYGVNSLEEDFNTFAEMAMTDLAAFRSYAEDYPLICLKARIIAEFYGSLGITWLATLDTLDCDATPLTPDMVRELQTILTTAGFDPRGIDGVVGPGTRAAITAAQEQLGVPADGAATFGLLTLARERFAAPRRITRG